MAGAGKKTFQVNEVLSAADVNDYLMDQSVMRFADDTARSSAIGTPSEGMVSYLDDSNQVEVYDGSGWVNFTGDITQVTAGTALTGGGTEGNVTLNVDETELFTGGTEGFTALSNGTAGLSYQPVSHNYIINGAFDIAQRGDGPFTTPSSGTSYTLDRFYDSQFNAGGTVSRKTLSSDEINAAGFGDIKYYAEIEKLSGNAALNFRTRIEDARTLAGQTVTLSFWAKSSASVSIEPRVFRLNANGTSLGSSLATPQTIGTSWDRYSFVINLDSLAGDTVDENGSYLDVDVLRFTLSDAFTLGVTGVQLEAGSIATPFKRNANSIQGELAACQRYYVQIDGNNTFAASRRGTDLIGFFVPLPVEMRSAPSASRIENMFVKGAGENEDISSNLNTASSLSAGGVELTASGLTFNPFASQAYVVQISGDDDLKLESEL